MSSLATCREGEKQRHIYIVAPNDRGASVSVVGHSHSDTAAWPRIDAAPRMFVSISDSRSRSRGTKMCLGDLGKRDHPPTIDIVAEIMDIFVRSINIGALEPLACDWAAEMIHL